MKRYFSILIFIMLSLFIGCKKSYIELTPIAAGTQQQFYNSANDFKNAVNATYSALQLAGVNGADFIFGDLTSDDTYANSGSCLSGHCDFDNFLVTASGSAASAILNNRWNNCYTGISRANAIISRIDAINMDAALKKQYTGEARFLRAYFYFTLVKTFGGVPLVLKELTTTDEAYTYTRETADNVYKQIETDLTDAASLLPSSYNASDAGRITANAARGMLGKVLLFQNKFTDALPVLKAVIDANIYTLINYADIFRYNNGNNKEILFSIQYTRGGIGQGAASFVGFVPENSGDAVQVGAGNGFNAPTPDIINAFDASDVRKEVSLATTYVNAKGVTVNYPYVKKFVDKGMVAKNETSVDYPVLRYADILLMYAECLNETGSTAIAIPYVNQVRTRANVISLGSLTQSDLRVAIEKERRLEFCFEGQRFFDLARTGRLLTVMNAYFVKYNLLAQGVLIQIKDYQKIFPVPQAQIDINPDKIKQNPGYNN